MGSLREVLTGRAQEKAQATAKCLERMERDLFREVFSSDKGKLVFSLILKDLGYFTPAKTEADRHRQDYAKELMNRVFPGDQVNALRVVEALFAIPLNSRKTR